MAVQAGVGIQHLHSVLHGGLVVVGTGVVGQGQHVGDGICAESCLLDGQHCEAVHFVVDAGCGLELAVLAVAVEFVAEGFDLVLPCGDEVLEVCHVIVEWLPEDVVYAALEGRADVVFRSPVGIVVIVAGCRPLARPVVEPECFVTCMSGSDDGSLASWCNGINEAFPFGGYLQFVADGGDGQVLGRGLFCGVDTRVDVIIDAEDGSQRLSVEPVVADDAVDVGACAGHQTGCCRCRVR